LGRTCLTYVEALDLCRDTRSTRDRAIKTQFFFFSILSQINLKTYDLCYSFDVEWMMRIVQYITSYMSVDAPQHATFILRSAGIQDPNQAYIGSMAVGSHPAEYAE
jgi:hypothetical protein